MKLIALDFTRLVCFIREEEAKKEGYYEVESYSAFYDRMRQKYPEGFDFFKFFIFNPDLLGIIQKLKSERDDLEFIIFSHKARKGFKKDSYYKFSIHEDPTVRRWLVDELKLFEDIVSTYDSKSLGSVYKHYDLEYKVAKGYENVYFIEKESCNVLAARGAEANVLHIDDFGRNPARIFEALLAHIDKGENIAGFFFEQSLR